MPLQWLLVQIHQVRTSLEMAAQGSKTGAEPTADLVRQWKKRNTMQIKKIVDACNNNFELQLLLLSEIENYEKVKSGSSGSVGDAVTQASKKKVKEEQEWDALPTGKLERWQYPYKKWGPSLIKQMALFCDPELRQHADSRVWKSKDLSLQVLEYGWDIKCTSGEGDYAAETDKGKLFASMKDIYIKKGSRLADLAPGFAACSLDWPTIGFYTITVVDDESGDEEPRVQLHSKALEKTITLEKGLVSNTETGKLMVTNNFSQTSAMMVSPSDRWPCANFFPSLNKSLKRKAGESPIVALSRPKLGKQVKVEVKGEDAQAGRQDQGSTAAAGSDQQQPGALMLEAVVPLPEES